MQVIYQKNNLYILRFQRKEEFMQTLLAFCKEKEIQAAWFQGLGAGDQAELSFYDINTKQYKKKLVDEEFEILSLTGNVALADNQLMVHAHTVLGKEDLLTIGGHVHSLKVSGTIELHLKVFETEFKRKLDEDTGLKLLSLE